MTLSEKIGLINEVCDNIEKMNNEDAEHYESVAILSTFHLVKTNIRLVQTQMTLKAIEEASETVNNLKKLTEEES